MLAIGCVMERGRGGVSREKPDPEKLAPRKHNSPEQCSGLLGLL